MNEQIRPVSQIRPDSIQIPAWLILRSDLTTNERMLVISLLMYAAHDDSPTLETLACLLGYKSTRNVQLLLTRLQDLGIVATKRRGCRPTIYYIYDLSLPRSNGKKRPIHDRGIIHDPTITLDSEGLKGDRGIIHDPTIMLIDSTEARPNAEKPTNHDPTIMLKGLGGGESYSGSESSKNQDSPPKGAAQKQTAVEKWLFGQNVGAASEFRDLDFAAVRDDFERRRAAGQPVGAIVKAWRAVPPTPDTVVAIEPTAYTPEWFAWIRVHRPELVALYRLGSDVSDLDSDDQVVEGDDLVVEGDEQ